MPSDFVVAGLYPSRSPCNYAGIPPVCVISCTDCLTYSVLDWFMADLRVRGRSCLGPCTMRLWRLVSSPAMDPGVSLSSRKSLCLGWLRSKTRSLVLGSHPYGKPGTSSNP